MFSMPEKPKRGEPAPCTTYPVKHFFPVKEARDGQPTAGERAALAVCARCPLTNRNRCLEDALRFRITDQNGVQGGTTAAQRKAIIRTRKAALKAVA